MAETRIKYGSGKLGKVIPARLLPGTDLLAGLQEVCKENGIQQGTILSAIGSLQKLTVMVLTPNEKTKLGAAYTAPQTIPGPIEILGIQGVILNSEEGNVILHLHGTFSDEEGKVYGGHVAPIEGENPILATLDVIIGEITDAKMTLRYDEETDLNIFCPE